ncbi:hypothetical protein L9F63_012323, partial [Diploptera punctata]
IAASMPLTFCGIAAVSAGRSVISQRTDSHVVKEGRERGRRESGGSRDMKFLHL